MFELAFHNREDGDERDRVMRLSRSVDWAYVPRRGDFVKLSPDLGGAEVKLVSFDRQGEACVQLGRTALSDEQLRELLESGWSIA